MPLVSVIVPNYNHERYLDERLQSIFQQTFTDYEVILLDDCSTDGSRQILEHYRNYPRVSHLVFNDTNSGSPFQQWKRGIDLAKGDWIWVAESDDFCDDQLLQSLTDMALKQTDVVLCYCQSNDVDETGKVSGDMLWHTDKIDKNYWKKDYYTDGVEEIRKCLWRYNSIPNASAVIFKKAAYLACHKQFEKMKMCGDWMLWVQLLKQGKIAFCANAHNSFRKHLGTTRVLADKQKIRTRFEEEYTIATEIKSTVGGLSPRAVRQKQWRISREYATLFSTSEIFSFLFKPWTYRKVVPLLGLSSFFFLRLAKTKIPQLCRTKIAKVRLF